MKKISILFIVFSSLFFFQSTRCSSQVVDKDTSLLDITYGWPAGIFVGYGDEGGFGPLGLKYEYMVAPKVGMGAIVNLTVLSDETFARIMAKFSFHFGQSDIFDGYTTIAAGANTYSDYLPIAARAAVGGRIFIDKLAILMEFGAGGGGLIEFGVSFKL